MFRYLAREPADSRKIEALDEGRLKLDIPDTLVFGEGENVWWLYTCENGFVHRRHDYEPSKALKKFTHGIDDDSAVVAVMKKACEYAM